MVLSAEYAVPIAVLSTIPLAFFLLGRSGFRQFGMTQSLLRIGAAMPLAISGVGHFIRTRSFAAIVPPVFPHPAAWVEVTGAFELFGFVGLLFPETARVASVGVALLMIAVFPANIYAAGRTIDGLHMPGIPLRLAMQVAYVLVVLLAAWGLPQRPTVPAEGVVTEWDQPGL
jgi:uncharacterized membrane protein